MNKSYQTSIIISIFIGLVLGLGNSAGRASRGQGNTGAPGDQPRVCQSCHNSAQIQVQVQLELFDQSGNVVNEYAPGQEYTLQATIQNVVGDPSAYGIQMVSITDSLFLNTGSWSQIPETLIEVNLNNRSYLEHYQPVNENSFTIGWVAPSENVGSISFYGAAAAVNGNGASSGDGAAADRLRLEVSTNIQVPIEVVYPNPTYDHLFVPSPYISATLYDLNGKILLAYLNNQMIDLSLMPTGYYLLELEKLDGEKTIHKILKI